MTNSAKDGLMKRCARTIMMLAAVASLSVPARAQFTAVPPAGLFLAQIKAGDEFALLLLGAYQNAYSWMNVELLHQARPPIYCQPEKVALANAQTASILEHYLQKSPKDAALPLGLVLKEALKSAFPCNEGNS